MNKALKILTLGAILSLTSTQILIAKEKSVADKTVTIEEMEINLAKLAKEISEEKVKLYQKEALLNDMKLDLLRQRHITK
jgi:hypothetical protein